MARLATMKISCVLKSYWGNKTIQIYKLKTRLERVFLYYFLNNA